jgi:uncharacterized cofD-like protein
MIKNSKIVVIGGGTGSFVLLSGLRRYSVELTAIVTVADSGGSTGRLRTEFGFLPVGDMRQCLAALTEQGKDDILRQLLLYRFTKGEGIRGHNLGNLILTALTDITGSEAKAIEAAAKIFRLQGQIFPITTTNIHLVAKYDDGSIIVGEHEIDEPKHKGGKKIIDLTTKPAATIYKEAKNAILDARVIVLGPGDLYTSILPNLVIRGVKETFALTYAKVVYVVNLMTRFSQTHNMTALDHVREIEKYLGRQIDVVVINKEKIPQHIVNLYNQEKGFPVKDDLGLKQHYRILWRDLLAPGVVVKTPADVLQRSYLRHNSQKLAETIISILH